MKKFFPLCLILIVALVWTVSIAGNIDRTPTSSLQQQQEVERAIAVEKVKEVVVDKPLSGPEKPGYIDVNAVETDEMTPEKAARIAEAKASMESINLSATDGNVTEAQEMSVAERDRIWLMEIKADGIVTDAERAEANEIMARIGYESDFPPVVLNQIAEVEPNDSCLIAQPIACGDTVMCANLAFGTDNNDWYTFTLDNTYASWDVTIETYRVAPGECPVDIDINDTYLELWGSPCDSMIAFDDDGSLDGWFSLINATLPPGTYAINSDATHWGGQTGSYHLSLDCIETPAPTPGDDCTDPIIVGSLPYSDLNQTNCGRGDFQNAGCLGYYDGGEDIFYQFTLASDTCVEVTVDFKTTSWSGFLVDDSCPDDGTCIFSIGNSATGVKTSGALQLTAGTYYIMVDTWPSPNCVPDFDLFIDIVDCPAACIVDCPPTSIPEGEPACSTDYVDNFNGGCNSDPAVFSTIACGDTICGETGTFLFIDTTVTPPDTLQYRDTDWYQFTLTAPKVITATGVAEVPLLMFLIDAGSGNCLDYTILTSGTADPCSTLTISAGLQPAGDYWLWVGPSVFTGYPCGSQYWATLACTDPPPPPANDSCGAAIAVAVPSTTPGTTVNATIDDTFPTCGTSITSPGVWYSATGTGNTMTASLCNGTATHDTKISVYCPDCGAPICVTGNDDFCGLQSEVSWCSAAGSNYLILVHGFGGATGPFDLVMSDDGTPCANPVVCNPPPPTGRCCYNDGANCLDNTEAECISLGGDWVEGLNCVDNPCCPEDELILDLTTDSWGSEVSWELTEQVTGDTIASINGTYASNSHYIHSICLDSTLCYDFNIHDAYGDGGGPYSLAFNGTVIHTSTGAYGFGETVANIGNGCAPPPPTWNCTDTPPDGKIAGGNIDIEPNDTCTTAQEALCEYAYCGDLQTGTDSDWYYVDIPAGVTQGLHVRVFGNDTPNQYAQGGGLDPWVGIYTSDCAILVVSNDDYFGTFPSSENYDSQLDPGGANCFQPGQRVYIEVTTLWNTPGPYLLIINCEPCEIPNGACCVDTSCVATNTEIECDALGGQWNIGFDCATYVNCAPASECDSTAIYNNGTLTDPQYISNFLVSQCDPVYPLQFGSADDFVLSGADSVTIEKVISWIWNWNGNVNGPDDYDGINITIYENDAITNPPVNQPAGEPVDGDPNCAHIPNIPNGIVYETHVPNGLYSWTEIVPPDSICRVDIPISVTLAPGVQYWLEIQPKVVFSQAGQAALCNSVNQTGDYSMRFAPLFGYDPWATMDDSVDIAFCLYGPGAPIGRCCYGPDCADNTEAECISLGGTWDETLNCVDDPCPTGCGYVVGDVNGSASYNGLDITYGVAFFKGGPDPSCPNGSCPIPPCDSFFYCGDVNGSCSYNGLDITYGVAYFKGGAGPIPCPSCPPVGGPSIGINDPEAPSVIKTKPVFEQKPSLK